MLFLDTARLLISPYYLSKAVAVKRIQKQLNISSEFTMIAGDGINDLPMLERNIAAMQIAPSNALSQVKKKVKQNGGVIGTLPYSDGVLEAARKLLNILH